MKLIALNCNHCGAPLEVPETANFVTCSFCETRLAVERTETTYSTTVLEQLQRKTTSLSREVAHLRLENELERLRREWEERRPSLMVRTQEGGLCVPNERVGQFTAVFCFTLGIAAILFTVVKWSLIPTAFALFFGLCGFVGLAHYKKGVAYNREFQRIKRQEEELQARIQSLNDEAGPSRKCPPDSEEPTRTR